MGCCNEPATALASATPDPTQHVNYARGMVLGVDDFTQEFAYLAGRDQWLARDAIGYGTLSGLRVYTEDDGAEGPRLHVSAGSALVPSGKLVCVTADQCAVINRWLARRENAALVYRLLHPVSPPEPPPSSPPPSPEVGSGVISLYLTLCSSDCLTRPVPVPGEPCRSEDDLMTPSRVADDFRLELRGAPPVQVEEDALRDFVRWLRVNVQVVDTSPSPAGDDASWLEALRPAAEPWLAAAAMSPPSPPPSFVTLGDYLFDLSPPELAVARDQLCDFLRVAFRFWVTELRPLWMARRCHWPAYPDQDCVLLARAEFEVVWVGGSPSGAWQIAGSPVTVTIDETTRPFLAHLRLLQEWLLCGTDAFGTGAGGGVSPPPSSSVPTVSVLRTGADLTLDDTHYCVLCDSASDITLALPPSDALNAGRVYVIKNVGAGTVTISADTGAGDRVENGASASVLTDRATTLVADGTNDWHIIGSTA